MALCGRPPQDREGRNRAKSLIFGGFSGLFALTRSFKRL